MLYADYPKLYMIYHKFAAYEEQSIANPTFNKYLQITFTFCNRNISLKSLESPL